MIDLDILLSGQKITISLPEGRLVIAKVSVPPEIIIMREHDDIPNEIVYSEILPEEL